MPTVSSRALSWTISRVAIEHLRYEHYHIRAKVCLQSIAMEQEIRGKCLGIVVHFICPDRQSLPSTNRLSVFVYSSWPFGSRSQSVHSW
jgi:hypothetical protein